MLTIWLQWTLVQKNPVILEGFPSPLSSRLTSSVVFIWPRIYLLNGSCHSPCPLLIASHFHLLTTQCFCLLLPCQLWPQFPVLVCLPAVFEQKEWNMICPVSFLPDFLSVFHCCSLQYYYFLYPVCPSYKDHGTAVFGLDDIIGLSQHKWFYDPVGLGSQIAPAWIKLSLMVKTSVWYFCVVKRAITIM